VPVSMCSNSKGSLAWAARAFMNHGPRCHAQHDKKAKFKVLFLIIPLFDFGWNFEQRRFPNHVWTLDPIRFVINTHCVMQEW
jgi:hypothetical protein